MIDWILEHWESIFSWIGLAVTTCTGIAGLTKTKKDDGIVSKIVKVADYLSVVNTSKNREVLEKYSNKK
jgi:hypothetical protein